MGAHFMPDVFAAQTKTQEGDKKTEGDGKITDALPLVIDDHTAPPAHTLPNRARTFVILTVGLTLWLLPFAAIGLWRGWDSLHAQEYRYFTQAALVTFGGAYAVLAYVTQALTTSPIIG